MVLPVMTFFTYILCVKESGRVCLKKHAFYVQVKVKLCAKLNDIKIVQCRKNQALYMNHLHV